MRRLATVCPAGGFLLVGIRSRAFWDHGRVQGRGHQLGSPPKRRSVLTVFDWPPDALGTRIWTGLRLRRPYSVYVPTQSTPPGRPTTVPNSPP
jgi:hypothetical protein